MLCGYIFVRYEPLTYELAMLPVEGIVGSAILLFLVLEASRRTSGFGFVAIILAMAVYIYISPSLPGDFQTRWVSPERLVAYLGLDVNSMIGAILQVAVLVVIPFTILGQVLARTGGADFFADISMAAMGRFRGGAAKIAVVGSALFGMISGSAVSNVLAVGIVTIPTMIKSGFTPYRAAAIESVGSTGGQLMPPVMGAAAFIMAETLQVPYSTIAIAAAIPGVLYFIAVGVMVHFEAMRRNLPVLSRAELPRLGAVLRRDAHLLVGPAVLVWLLVEGRSPMFAGFWALVASFALSWVRRGTRIGLARALAILADSAQAAMPVALACATVGIVVGVVATTGLGLKLATGIVGLAGGSLLGTLLLTMVAALVLGTGLPTSATYIITSIMAAPALEQLGIPKLVAHMFVFYFGILADLTPPTAISTYATSSIAGAEVWRTQWLAMMLALSGFVIPFSFAYDPAILLISASWAHIAWRTLAATLGIVMLGAGLIGWFRAPTRSYERALLLVGAALLILPGFWSDVAGLVCFAVVWLAQRASQRAPAPAPAASVVSPRD
ncbi:MAG: TRAP transporter fused permease subunit [Alphaproteobacteria bacterium]|nr:MAG: TRAP transporter fused permease subunit [Alphaproteobacteria bacterium]